LVKVDPNGKRTELAYDALGRLSQVWLANHLRSSYPTNPNIEHSYLIRNTGGANTVTTKRLNASSVYSTAYTLYDGLLRIRQTQEPAVAGGGTVFNETIYDAAGRAAISNNFHYDAALTPGVNLVTVLDWQNKSQTVTEFDRAGRKVASIVKSSGQEKWRSTTGYGGDRVYFNPPAGVDGTPTTTISDIRGKTTEVRQHSGGSTSGPYDATTFT
jgi:YD repeat-containing protein